MSQYNKTVLTNAGLELAKRANAGQAKFEITRAVTSADDWSNKTIQDIEAVTAIPNIMQQGTIRDTEEVESNNSVIGVSLCFANKDLSAGYQIKIIGVYVREEGQDKDFLYAVTTAVTPEYMPDFSDGVLYRFNMQMYLVIGKAQAVNVVINDGASVTHGQFDKYKSEVTANLEKIENAHKEDMSHVVKSASINGGGEILPDEAGKLELVVPDPDLSKYVNIDDLKEMLNTKANISDVYTKSDVDSALAADRGRLGKLEGAQTLDSPDFNSITATGVYYITNKTPANIKNNPASQCGVLVVSNGDGHRASQVYYPDDGSSQWCRLLNGSNWLPWYQLSTKKDVSNATNLAKQVQETANTKANASDVYTKSQTDGKLGQKITFVKCDSPQVAHDASTKPAADGSIVLGIYDMNDEPSQAVVGEQKINIEWLYNHLTDLQSTVNSGLATKANQSDLNSTTATVESQASEIASLKAQLNDAVNQISYIKANYVEGRRFTKSQEAQATAWENENPQRIAFITDD